MKRRRLAICNVCGGRVKLTRKGAVRRHHPWYVGELRKCSGTGRKPYVILPVVAERVAGLSPLSEQRHSGVQMGGAL